MTGAMKKVFGLSQLDGFKRVGLGYERSGFGGRKWRVWREHGGFRVQLEPLTPDRQIAFEQNGDVDLLDAFKPLVDEFSPTFGNAIAIARLWDEQLDR